MEDMLLLVCVLTKVDRSGVHSRHRATCGEADRDLGSSGALLDGKLLVARGQRGECLGNWRSRLQEFEYGGRSLNQ
jgi:hypothetical protein